MASVPVQEIVDALATALASITVANDYNTDLGLNVRTERTETGIPSTPRCTVGVYQKQRGEGGNSRPGRDRLLRGVIEFEVPASYTNAMAQVLAAEEDIDRLLSDVYTQMPGALPVMYEETVILDRPDGMPVVAAEIHWSTGYRRHE